MYESTEKISKVINLHEVDLLKFQNIIRTE